MAGKAREWERGRPVCGRATRTSVISTTTSPHLNSPELTTQLGGVLRVVVGQATTTNTHTHKEREGYRHIEIPRERGTHTHTARGTHDEGRNR